MSQLKSLNTLLEDIADVPTPALMIAGLTLDSRQVTAGDAFISLAKTAEQRMYYCQQAITAGAVVIITDAETVAELSSLSLAVIAVEALAAQASELAARFYDHPSRDLQVIAVTGTNGKTSVTQFIASALEILNTPCGIIGTLGCGRVGHLHDIGMTTPDPVLCQKILADFRDQGLRYVVLEASSHALAQQRLAAVAVDIAVLTNLSRDHLDYHGSMQAYAAAKQQLFAMSSVTKVVINQDEIFGQTLLQQGFSADVEVIRYSRIDAVDWYAQSISAQPNGLDFQINAVQQQRQLQLPLIGMFNVENVLATAAVLDALGITFDAICSALPQLHSITGRMQRISAATGPAIVVDYAHTPDALEQALTAMQQHLSEAAQLWCVFGCGGERDAGKRPMMGQVAQHYADQIVLTDDNPRSEQSQLIIADILHGMDNANVSDNVHIDADRQQAIFYSVHHAANQDMILVAGKGHETYQERHGIRTPFSDAAVITAALEQRQQQTETAS